MIRFLVILACFLPVINGNAFGAATAKTNATPGQRAQLSDYMDPQAYDNLYPMMNNQMKTRLNPGVTPSQTQNPIASLVKTSDISTNGRRVVSRTNTARSASTKTVAPTTVARSGTNTAVAAAGSTGNQQAPARRVVSRGNAAQNATVRAGRSPGTGQQNIVVPNTESLPADRCLADYTQCMNGYCERKNASYNRCYCSARLAQIDAQYQPAIDSLIKQLLVLGNTNTWTQSEMNDYWDQMIGTHTGDNSWLNLDDALDIDWADTESRVRGQQAFVAGHEYCVQHLRGCSYMAANMRDAYRSDISRDCAAYETSLQKIKNVAESIVENYND